MVCLYVKDNIATIVTLVSTIAGVVGSVLALPKIIGGYLFPQDEDDNIKDLFYHFKDSDDRQMNSNNNYKDKNNKKE